MRAILVTLCAVALLAAGCGSGGSNKSSAGHVTLGTKNFPEEFVLGQLYKQALEAKGFSVTYKENIGSTELIQTSLTSGSIDAYPEYIGIVVQDVFNHQLSAKTAQATYALAKRLEAQHGYTLLQMTPFSDTDAVAVTKQTAAKYGLHSLGDLKKVPSLRLGGLPEFRTRNTGLVGLRRNYGLTKVTFVPLAGLSPYVALDTHKVDAAAVFSTDPPLGKNSKYVVLSDPVHQFGFQNVAPIVRTSVVKKLGSSFTDTMNAVSAKLTQQAIVAMNKAVIVDKQKPAAVARAFLQANGLS